MSKITKDKKRLLSNFFSLSAIQGVNMILPLITLPYLVRVLGVENFGLVNFSLSIVMYFNIFVSFGFELSATRNISIHRNNVKKIRKIFAAVMTIKIILALLSFSILSILLVTIDSLKENVLLYYATFGIVVGNVIFPSWFFQGMERMQYITYINVTSRIAFTILIFVFVKESTDFIYVPILNSLGAIIGGFYSLWLVFKLFDMRLVAPSNKMILLQVKDSYHFFLSRIAGNGSRYYATTIIGIYFGNITVGYYAMVEKLYYAFMTLGSVVSQVLYPYMSRTRNVVFFKKIIFIITDISIIFLVPILYLSEPLLNAVFNVQSEMLSKMFVIIFSGSIFGIVSTLLGYPLLAAFGYVKFANNSLIFASIIYVISITIFATVFHNIYLVSFSVVVYALVGLIFRMYYVYKTKVLQ